MALYLAIGEGGNGELAAAVATAFPYNFYEISDAQFVVSAKKMTAKQVSETLGVSTGRLGRVLVVNLQNYTGWHKRELWDWLSTNRVFRATS